MVNQNCHVIELFNLTKILGDKFCKSCVCVCGVIVVS